MTAVDGLLQGKPSAVRVTTPQRCLGQVVQGPRI
jgi:hypothetical protein